MTLLEKIDIIRDKGIDFLGYDEIEKIINKIIEKQNLQQDLLKTPDSFWEDAKKGLLVYSDYVNYSINEDQKEEQIVTKYQDYEEKKNIPALVYQRQMEKARIR